MIGQEGRASLYPLAGGNPRPIPGLEPGDVPIRWSADERALFVFRKSGVRPSVYTIELVTGRNELWKEIVPADSAGTSGILLQVTPDGRSYMYDTWRELSDLYLVEGLK